MRKRKKTSKDINAIVNFVHEYDGLKLAEKKMQEYTDKALSQLRELPSEKGTEDFEALIKFIITRKK